MKTCDVVFLGGVGGEDVVMKVEVVMDDGDVLANFVALTF